MDRKKILILTDIYPRTSSDYRGIFVESIAHCIHSKAVQVDVVNVNLVPLSQAKLSRLYFSRNRKNGQNIIWIGAFSIWPKSSYVFSTIHLVLSLIALALLHTKYDLIHAHNGLFSGNSARLIGEIFGIPFVLTEHRKSYPQFIKPDELKIYGKVLKAADRILLPSESFRREFCTIFPYAKPKAIFFPNILSSIFTWPLDSDKSKSVVGPVKILFVGNLIDMKGPQFVYDGCREFLGMVEDPPDIELSFVGVGALSVNLKKKLTTSINDRLVVRFAGALDHNTLRLEYDAATLVCIPSKSETFGCALVESISQGTPVIAIKGSGGPDDFVNNENGLLVDRDAGAIALGIINMLERIREEKYKSNTMRKSIDVYLNENNYRKLFFENVLQQYEA